MITLSSKPDERVLVRPVVCDWDASSRRSGTSDNAGVWASVLERVEGLEPPVVLNRRLGELIPSALVSVTSSILDAGERPLLLGGDHRLTYSPLSAICHRHGPGTVHHFDAHHDAHPMPTLSNFSVFDFAARRLGTRVVRYGCREERQVPPGDLRPAADHVYISIDLDYLDPDAFASVSFPERVPEGMSCTADSLLDHLDGIAEHVAATGTFVTGADVVEWRGPDATTAETDTVVRVLERLTAVMSPTTRRTAAKENRP